MRSPFTSGQRAVRCAAYLPAGTGVRPLVAALGIAPGDVAVVATSALREARDGPSDEIGRAIDYDGHPAHAR